MKSSLHRIMLLFLSFLLAGSALAACSSPNNQPQVQETRVPTQISLPTTSPASEAKPGSEDSKNAVIQALLLIATRANRMDVTTVLADGSSQVSSIEFVPPDRKRILDVNSGMEYLIIADKVYSRSGPMAEWSETPIPASTFMGDNPPSVQTIGQGLSDETMVGEDTLDGKQVTLYRFNQATTTNGVDLHNQTELWVGVDDGLPYKMVIDGEVLSASVDPITGESLPSAAQAQTTTMISFDPTLTIEAPAP
jgi:hypothetical protein